MVDRRQSPLGDRRERSVRCVCGRRTWNYSAFCDRCEDAYQAHMDRLGEQQRDREVGW